MTSPSETHPVGRWAAFENRAFMKYWLSRLVSSFAMQIQTVAVGWQVYDLTRDPLDLGLVGLSQFLPALLLVLVTGAVADRFRRRTIMAVCVGIEALCAAALLPLHTDRLRSPCPSSWCSSDSARRAPSTGRRNNRWCRTCAAAVWQAPSR